MTIYNVHVVMLFVVLFMYIDAHMV